MESEFLGWLSENLGASRNTLIAYGGDLRVFARFLVDCPVEAATTTDVTEFLRAEKACGRAYSTRVRRMTTLRKFFGWLVTSGRRTDDPTTDVTSPRPPRAFPKTERPESRPRTRPAPYRLASRKKRSRSRAARSGQA